MSQSVLVNQWIEEYDELKSQLYTLGATADSVEYNVIASQAMQLHECILGLVLDSYGAV